MEKIDILNKLNEFKLLSHSHTCNTNSASATPEAISVEYIHKVNRLYIHWDVSTKCQLNCAYCYAIKQYSPDGLWNKQDTWIRQKLVIAALKRSTLPIFLGFQGGEPTIHPRFLELMELSWKAINRHPDSRLYITTNSIQPLEFFESLPDIDYYENSRKQTSSGTSGISGGPKIYFLWSIHFEYIDKYNQFIDKILTMQNKGYRNKVNVMLHPDKKYWPFIKNIISELITNGIEIHPHFLYDDGDMHKLHNYTEEFYNEFRYLEQEALYKPNIIYWSDPDVETPLLLNDYDIYSKKFAHFKGWDCYNNNYEINFLGEVKQFCFTIQADLTANFNFFKNIKTIVPKCCPHNGCFCDGLLKTLKVKNRGLNENRVPIN
jgi:organic radical activating enzyme